MEFRECYKSVAKEALGAIEHYRVVKENSIFDYFYHSHLDLFQDLIDEYLSISDKYVALIIAKRRPQYKSGNSTPVYVTVCKKPHWSWEGIMTTGGFHDATKFNPFSKDLYTILKWLNRDDEKYETVLVDKRCLESIPNEYWEDEFVRGDWDETHCIGEEFLNV